MNNPKMIKETIQCGADLQELLSGDFTKVRQGLQDLEDTFGSLYNSIEIAIEEVDLYDNSDIDIKLYGFRPETPEETIAREEREKKAREKRLIQLDKDKKALEKKRKQL